MGSIIGPTEEVFVLLYPPPRNKGFSLVELSIVLVILGLLVGGVLSGQSLIRAAELRALNTEYQRYTTAAYTFRDKYMALPGDMPSATKFWGTASATGCNSNSGVAASGTGSGGSCDGDGNGMLGYASGTNASGEIYRFWQQLALAKLVEGTYTGNSGPSGSSTGNGIIGENEPASKISNAAWGTQFIGSSGSSNFSGSTDTYAGDYGNVFRFGTQASTDTGPSGKALKPEELWGLDKKVDDGKPGTGHVVALHWNGCTESNANTEIDKDYKLIETGVKCAFVVRNAF